MGAMGRETKGRLAEVTVDDEVFDGPAPADRVAFSEPSRVGRFPLIRRLGAGGMGAVYAAYDELLDRKVALKIMHPQRTGSLRQRQRTLVEARALARVTHPSVVTVYEVGEADNNIYISMEYIEGKTLSDWCGDAPRTWRQILDMYLQAGAGLYAAHQAGIVHRDVKPSNVLVGRDGRPHVVDFGLARLGEGSAEGVELPSALSGQHRTLNSAGGAGQPGAAAAAPTESPPTVAAGERPSRVAASLGGERVTRIGSISGTPGYMSPEQYIGGDVDSQSDQFSFCAALFEALYGFLPFPGETLEELADSVHGPVRTPPPSSKVPLEVHRAILRGLSVKPEERFPSMGELLAALSVEHGHSAAAGAQSRKSVLRPVALVSLILIAVVGLRIAQRTMSTRDAAISSAILVAAMLAAGGLYRQTLLSNTFHRRVYLLILLGMGQNLLQRTVGYGLGFQMRHLFPFEMVVWTGVSSLLIGLGLRSLLPLPFFLLGMGALVTLWQDIPKPAMLLTYAVVVLSLAWSWLHVGRSPSAPAESGTGKGRGGSSRSSLRRPGSGSGPGSGSSPGSGSGSSQALRPVRPSPPASPPPKSPGPRQGTS
jgi:serine/threonine protein kinase